MDAPLGIAGRMTALFQNNRLTPLLAITLLLTGLFALLVTPREEEPQIDVTMATVSIAWPGAAVRDIEGIIAAPAERILSRIDGMDHVMSVSTPGLAVLTAQFKVGVPRDEALVRLHDTLRTHADWLPADLGVQPPVIRPKGVDDVPIITLTLHAADTDPAALQRVARSIESDLKRVPGTRDIWIIGGSARAVRIDLDAARLARADITLDEVTAALQGANFNAHAGELLAGNRSLTVGAGGFLKSVEDVAGLIVGLRDERPIYLREIAAVSDQAPPPAHYVRHYTADDPEHVRGQPAVTLAITKKPGENAIQVADAVMQRVSELRGQLIPEQIQVTETRNYGATANDKARTLILKLAFATLSVVLLVMVALGRREALIVGLAVGLTLAATLFASWAWGFTLNRVSLFALIFSIGILVDDAIVVVENIHRHGVQHPDTPLLKRIPAAVDEVGGPTILATFTVIAALLPMAFVSGLMGPYMSPIPINASMGMLISLLIALTLTPWLAVRLEQPGHARVQPEGQASPPRIHRWFARTFRPFLTSRRARLNRHLLGLATLGLVALSALLPVAGWVELKMLPFDDKSEFQVVVDMPAGTPLEETDAVLQSLATHLLSLPEVTHVQSYAGTASPINFNGLVRQYDLRRDPASGDLQVNLKDKSLRRTQSHALAMRARPALAAIAAHHGATLQVVEVPPGPPVLAPIVAQVYGPDAEGRLALARAVRAVFEQTDGMVDVNDSSIATAPRLQIEVDRERAARAGVPQAAVADALRTGLSGAVATYLHDGGTRPTPIVLRLPPEEQGGLGALRQLPVRGAHGRTVPVGELLREVGQSREQPAHRKDLLPVQYVTADMAGMVDSPLYGMFAARTAVLALPTPDGRPLQEHFIAAPENPYAAYAIKWDGEWQITYETFRDMGLAYTVGLLLIYLLVVAHFGSYRIPLIIMAPIPLTLIGVMPGHALLGKQFTATSMIGMIALAGIIVRNSILLVDFVIRRLREGSDFAAAVIESAAERTRPIILTGIAAMLGAFFILDDPIFNGLAIALIFGILVSTALTLVVIPLLVYSVYRKHPSTLCHHGD